jgi:beta-glucanase (GH16 family)
MHVWDTWALVLTLVAAVLLTMTVTGTVTTGTMNDRALAAAPRSDRQPVEGQPADPANGGWTLVWSDEFDGPEIDRSVWTFMTGNGHAYGIPGWGNAELQYYTDRPANAYIADGKLVIRALRETWSDRYGTYAYTSARLTTKGRVSVKYGRIEVRAKLPEGKGIWPAIWMLGDDIDTKGWPASGEIDIMELVGHKPGTVYGTVHGPLSGGTGIGGSYSLPGGRKFSEDFRVFALEWTERELRWYVDGELYHVVSKDRMPRSYAEREWVYDHPFYFILNVAVGGRWPGYPDDTNTFPQAMEIDYIRIYEARRDESELPRPTPGAGPTD